MPDNDDAEWLSPNWEKMLKEKYESDHDFLEEIIYTEGLDKHIGDCLVSWVGYLDREDVKEMLLNSVSVTGLPDLAETLVDVLRWALGKRGMSTSYKVVSVQECRFCGLE